MISSIYDWIQYLLFNSHQFDLSHEENITGDTKEEKIQECFRRFQEMYKIRADENKTTEFLYFIRLAKIKFMYGDLEESLQLFEFCTRYIEKMPEASISYINKIRYQ